MKTPRFKLYIESVIPTEAEVSSRAVYDLIEDVEAKFLDLGADVSITWARAKEIAPGDEDTDDNPTEDNRARAVHRYM